jgi:copper chaperone CopZ
MGVDGVINADVSLSGRRAIVKDDGTSSVDSLIAAVIEEGYDANFTGVESKSY